VSSGIREIHSTISSEAVLFDAGYFDAEKAAADSRLIEKPGAAAIPDPAG
jgi:hypothetical protein